MRYQQLEERLIDYAVVIISFAETIQKNDLSRHLCNQLVRSGTSPALNYAEAVAAESRRDFIHKNKIVLKELRESFVCLKIISRTQFHSHQSKIDEAMNETNELISIFVSSIKTAQKRNLSLK